VTAGDTNIARDAKLIQRAEEALEWIADFNAGMFHVHCHQCGAGAPYLPPEFFGLLAENEMFARAILDEKP
jgi:hypothetical protein